jgi:hypothetical protein
MMSKFEQPVPIVEEDAKRSLEVVLNEVAIANHKKYVLTKHRFEKLGTREAKVVLVYEKVKRDSDPAPVGPGSPSATPEEAPMAPTLFCPPEGWVLGTLSSKYETSGRGPGTVSSGMDDPGGVSYGSYQMTSSGGGTVRKFVSDAAFPWRDRFAGLTPGSEQFSDQWKALARDEPEAFFKAQHAFIERTHFAPLVQNIKSACGLDVTQRSHALQDAVWSTAVQHGPNTPVITIAIEAVGGVESLPPSDLDGERRLIRAIYAERGRKSSNGGLAYFPRVKDMLIQQSLAERFVNEARDALAMLDFDV